LPGNTFRAVLTLFYREAEKLARKSMRAPSTSAGELAVNAATCYNFAPGKENKI
jgi:hypothetical protein